MQIPKEARRKAREIFDASLDASGRPDPARVIALADQVIASAPRRTLQILKEYARLVRLATERHHAVVESATQLDDVTLASVVQSLKQRDGGDISLETKVNPSLIGGARIRLGSEVWDATVRTRLQNLTTAVG